MPSYPLPCFISIIRKEWDGSASDKRLKDWLDTDGNNNNEIDGRDPCFTDVFIENEVLRSAHNDYQPYNNVLIQAGNTITTLNVVEVLSSADYTFRAGFSIKLNSGFKVEAGASFKTEIAACHNYKYINSKTKSASKNPNLSISEVKKEIAKDISIETGYSIIKVYPNPVTSIIGLELEIPQKNRYSIRLINLFGITVKVLTDEILEPGVHEKKYDLSTVPIGIYLLSISTADYHKYIKIIKNGGL